LKKQKESGQRKSQNLVVLSYHSTVNNEGDIVQFGVRVECHDTSRSVIELPYVPKFHCGRVQQGKKNKIRFVEGGTRPRSYKLKSFEEKSGVEAQN